MLLAVTVVAAVGGAGVGSAQSSPLTGKTWVLTALLGKPPLEGTKPTSVFTPAGDVSGSAGCNHYGGRFAVSGSTIKISSLVSTLMGCPPKIAAQEAAFLKALGSARTFHVERREADSRVRRRSGSPDLQGAIPAPIIPLKTSSGNYKTYTVSEEAWPFELRRRRREAGSVGEDPALRDRWPVAAPDDHRVPGPRGGGVEPPLERCPGER